MGGLLEIFKFRFLFFCFLFQAIPNYTYCTFFQAGLLRLPLNRLLEYLKSLARRDFLSNPDYGVLKVN